MTNDFMFENRIDAGKKLAESLVRYQGNVLVLALPRGGVPVGYEVAKRLGAPLDTVVVRKLGAPSNPEFGIGAIAPGDVIVLDNISIKNLNIKRSKLDQIITQETREMGRRLVRYKSGEYSKDSAADTIILVDDGLATGITARAAIESVKLKQSPKEIIFAAPVCARDRAESLRGLVDDMVCLGRVDNLVAIGRWYRNFDQTTDEEVVEYLERASQGQ